MAGALVTGALAALSYARGSAEDPGLTTEVALLATYLLGALALREPAAGFADAHAPAISIASLVSAGKLDAPGAVTPVLAALSTNTLSKIVLATAAGGRRFAWAIVPGLLLVIAAAWAGALVGR